ncbi:hypothetical protein [Acinetobacter tjernbergiae]|uniref:Uncharacterized protein n=1 Tax=Acinetobacter tjernbergiae DSM 14971 = CIP 107465 TaxID=1120928 RepID=V2V5P4_9GAMM|nr:hypothetical protein [Acinetobacter tjernbergiae]ESK56196.1 hypothetical protein F990_01194 [Acinetobacter tjernbergiae DSM 14971 = CIP 107465]
MPYKILNYYGKIFIIFIIIFSSKYVYAERVADPDTFLKMLISQQLLFADCRKKYPQQMQEIYGAETNVFEALDKNGRYDKNFKANVDKIFIHLDPEKKQSLTQEVTSEFKQVKNKEGMLCTNFLTQKKHINLKLNKIVYDPKTMLFYLNIQNYWLQAKITSDALPCNCEEKNTNLEEVRQFTLKNRNKILKTDLLYMQQREDGVNEASMMIMWKNDHQELSQSETQALSENNRIIDDFGFESIVPIEQATLPANLTSFLEGEYALTYECKIDYIHAKNSTCIKTFVK